MLGMKKALNFLNDIYWPVVCCETGWFGLIGIVIILFCVFFYLQKIYNIDKKMYAGGMFVLGYMMITTFESTSFANPATFILSLPLGLIIGGYYKLEKEIG